MKKIIEDKCQKCKTDHNRIKSTSNFIFGMWVISKKPIYHSFFIFSGKTLSILIPVPKKIRRIGRGTMYFKLEKLTSKKAQTVLD